MYSRQLGREVTTGQGHLAVYVELQKTKNCSWEVLPSHDESSHGKHNAAITTLAHIVRKPRVYFIKRARREKKHPGYPKRY